MIYAFTGMPLAGKSTYSRSLALRMKLPRMSTGDFARSLGMGIEPSISRLDLSKELNAQINAKVMDFVGSSCGDCVIDGFPRSEEQFHLLEAWGYPFKVFFMTANPLVIFDRLRKRSEEERRPEDVVSVVMGRVRRSVEWRMQLKQLAGGAFVDILEGEGAMEFLERSI